QTATDLTGTEFTKLYQYLDKSAPVIVYNSVYLKTPIDVASYTLSGKTWHFYHNEHCVVLCGYDPARHMVLINDSLSGLVWRSEEAFARIYDRLGKMAVLIR
ncbi:MAG: C39 family peptidase, partial [Blautia glucerasea]|nr:C39 family peptidase [Blautia glucerasea]